jgi:uncharacterized protein
MSTSKHHILWHGIQFALTDLVNKLGDADFIPDAIIGIGRGGLIPATLLAYKLNVKDIYNYSVRSYNDLDQRETIQVIQGLDKHLTDKKLLVVDDLSDSGNTLSYIKQQLNQLHTTACDIKIATLFIKSKTSLIPDFYSSEYQNETWLVFPWETDDD